MEQVAKENPAKALEFMQSFAQFNVPLLARTEHGGGIAVESTVRVIDDTNQ